MKIIEHIEKAKDTLLSYEILPPLKGKNIQSIYQHLDPLMEFKPSWINVTYHRSEAFIRTNEKGEKEKIVSRKRPGTVGICSSIMNHYNVDAVPHLICGGFSKYETEDALIDLNFLGIDNILALRGDAASNEPIFVPHPEGHRYAVDLVKQIVDLNQGKYLDRTITNAQETDFCIGVAGYPECHFECTDVTIDLKHLKAKVDAGASYIMTQMFFDNEQYFRFVENCRKADIHVPIIPGLKPLTTVKQITVIPKIFSVAFPDDLHRALTHAKTDEDVETIGIEWLVQQCKSLKAYGAPVLHFYTLGKPDVIRRVIEKL